MKTFYKTTALLFAAGLAAALGCSSAGGSGCGNMGGDQTRNTLNCGSGTHEDPKSHACVADTQAQKNRVGANGSTSHNTNGSEHVSNAP